MLARIALADVYRQFVTRCDTMAADPGLQLNRKRQPEVATSSLSPPSSSA